LLIFDNIWVDPHDLSRLCRDQNETFCFLLFSHRVDDIQSYLRDWDQSVLDSHLWECPKVKVTMLAVTFFCSVLRVRTPASTRAGIISLRT